MQQFTPLEYLLIDIANCFGMDKETWRNRIQWSKDNLVVLEALDSDAESPILFRKAVRALRKVEKGLPTNHIMGLDATASGPQFMSAASGCANGMEAVNLIDTGTRRDAYTETANAMSSISGQTFDRSDLKQPQMTYFYGSTAVPKAIFGQWVAHFHAAMESTFPGAAALMRILQAHWNPTTSYYSWTMPDGHRVHIPVTTMEKKGMEIDEYDHFRYTYQMRVVKPVTEGRSLAANVIHSIDAWACRQMVRRCAQQGFQVAPIHDCFFASPKHMQRVRENYRNLMIEVYERNMIQDILTQLTGKTSDYEPMQKGLSHAMWGMDYALS
jgi:DNA-directed RNA polymerase